MALNIERYIARKNRKDRQLKKQPLTEVEQACIQLNEKGYTQLEVAKLLDRAPSVIGKALKRAEVKGHYYRRFQQKKILPSIRNIIPKSENDRLYDLKEKKEEQLRNMEDGDKVKDK